jgi:hypothetical protein
VAVRPFYRGRAVNDAVGITTQAWKKLRSDAHSRCTAMTGVEHAPLHINCIIDSLDEEKINYLINSPILTSNAKRCNNHISIVFISLFYSEQI